MNSLLHQPRPQTKQQQYACRQTTCKHVPCCYMIHAQADCCQDQVSDTNTFLSSNKACQPKQKALRTADLAVHTTAPGVCQQCGAQVLPCPCAAVQQGLLLRCGTEATAAPGSAQRLPHFLTHQALKASSIVYNIPQLLTYKAFSRQPHTTIQ